MPLEIKDQYGDLLKISDCPINFVHFTVKGRTQDENDAESVEINEGQAREIISHLQKQFEL
jgi:hypothetical protein